MTSNIEWFEPEVKEAWAYEGRLYRSEAKAMQEYNQRVISIKRYIQRLEDGLMKPWRGTVEETIASYVKTIDNLPKPRRFKVVWDETDLA